MKKHLTIVVLLFLAVPGFGQTTQSAPVANAEEKGIHFFHGTWAELMAEAKKENKPIFVDAYASWCGPCRYMAANIFTDKEVGEYYNKHFVCYKFDMEKGEGPNFARQNKVEAYPTLFYFDKSGTMKNRVLGLQQKESLLSEGKKAVAATK